MAICNYKQNDPTWAAYPYAGETMGPAGCGPTACADLLGISPVTAASWLTSHGYASNGSGTFHSGITAILRTYGYTASQITGASYAGIRSSATFEVFKDHIKKGGCGIILFGGIATGCRTDYWSRYGHYCAVVGYRESDGTFLIHDPAWDARDGWHNWDNDIAGNIKHLFTCSISWKSSSSASSSAASSTTESSTKTGGYKLELSAIKFGSKGQDVKIAQIMLKGLGYYTGKIDGEFGNGTHTATVAFQKAHGMAGDGEIGKNTWGRLFGK